MEIELVSEISRFRELENDWNNLLAKSVLKSIFLTWEWLFYWWLHFGSEKELFILIVKCETTKEIFGIAPFFKEKINYYNLLSLKKIKFLGTGKVASDFLDFIIYPGEEKNVLKAIYEYIDKKCYKWDIVEIGDIDKNSSSIEFLKLNVNGAYKIFEEKSQTCPYLKLPESYELLLKSFSPNMRSNLKRRMQQIQTKKEVSFSICRQKEQLRKNIDNLFSLHSKRFKEKHSGGTSKSSFSGDAIKNFHYDIADKFFLNGWLGFYSVELENKIVALLYAFQYKDRLFYYQSGFDPKWTDLGLGNVLFSYSINNSINNGLCEFHFLRGNEEYKLRWTKEFKKTINVFIYNKNFVGLFFYYYKRIKETLKDTLKR